MKRRFLIILLTLLSVICCAAMFSACNVENSGGNGGTTNQTQQGGGNQTPGGSQTETPGGGGSSTTPGGNNPGGGSSTHTHEFSNVWSSDEVNHWHAATCGHTDKKDEAPHTYVNGVCTTCNHAHENHVYENWIVTEEASCTKTGQQYHVCYCGHTESEVIPTKAHSYTDCVCDTCGAIEPGAVAVDYYVDNKLQGTLYTNAEKDYKINLPERYDSNTYFDGWYANTEYMEPLTGDETYHSHSTIYARWISILNFEFKVDNGEASIVKCKSTTATAVVIPRFYLGIYQITSIAPEVFKGMTTIRWLFILSPMRTIGNNAFDGCNSIKKVVLPDSVTSIGWYAFKDCTSLASVTIPNSVTSIGGGAFSGCTSLTSVTISNGVTSIGDYAFDGCTSLKSVNIPDSVTSIGGSAFRGCTKLMQTENDVQYVDKWVVGYDTSVTNVNLRKSTKGIADDAFLYCYNLTSITIPDSVTSIGGSAFWYCTSLKSVTIPDSVTSIGGGAFYNCTSLTSIIIPESVTSIGDAAFGSCTSLKSITLPFVGNGSDETHFGYIFGASSYNYNSKYVPTSLKTVEISGGKSISADAFGYCRSLTSITIPNSVISIGDYAFYNCTSLATVYYGGDTTQWNSISIGYYNTDLKNATRYYFSETEPDEEMWAESKNWWHYDPVTGEIDIWKKD